MHQPQIYFLGALLNNADSHVAKSDEAAERGSIENQETHLLKAINGLKSAVDLMKNDDFMYPKLTVEENKLLHILEASEFADFGADSDAKLLELRKKAGIKG